MLSTSCVMDVDNFGRTCDGREEDRRCEYVLLTYVSSVVMVIVGQKIIRNVLQLHGTASRER